MTKKNAMTKKNSGIVTRSRAKKLVEKGKMVERNSRIVTRSMGMINNVSVSIELVLEILKNLRPKAIAKLMFVSTDWYAEIRNKHFTDMYLARSLTRPCLLIMSSLTDGNWFFRSASHDQVASLNQYSTTRTTLTEDYRMSQPVRGLVCGQRATKIVACNPSTGQVVDLPNVRTRRKGIATYFGYDYVHNEYKVLCMTVLLTNVRDDPIVSGEHQVFTLGDVKKKFRMIECQHPHYPVTRGFFRNGVVYYGAWSNSDGGSFIVAFDVRLEKFGIVKLPENAPIREHGRSDLVNYHNKIALVNQTFNGDLDLWILEDEDQQVLSKISVVVPNLDNLIRGNLFHCIGTISTGELVFAPGLSLNQQRHFMVYYDLKEDYARRVDIEGPGDPFAGATITFLDHVESPMIL